MSKNKDSIPQHAAIALENGDWGNYLATGIRAKNHNDLANLLLDSFNESTVHASLDGLNDLANQDNFEFTGIREYWDCPSLYTNTELYDNPALNFIAFFSRKNNNSWKFMERKTDLKEKFNWVIFNPTPAISA